MKIFVRQNIRMSDSLDNASRSVGLMAAMSPLAGMIETAISMVLGRDGLAGIVLALVLRAFKMRIYETHRTKTIRTLLDTHRPMSTRLYNNQPTGVVWCREFIGICDRSRDIAQFTFVATEEFYRIMCPEMHQGALPGVESRMDVAGPLVVKSGFVQTYMLEPEKALGLRLYIDKQPTPEQAQILVDARRCLHKNGRCTLFVDGPPGSGKSTLGPMLAASLGDALCLSVPQVFGSDKKHDPMYDVRVGLECHTGFEAKYSVMVLDDVGTQLEDAILKEAVSDDMHRGRCRTSWNVFFDQYQNDAYLNSVLVITSNVSYADISARDPSILRKGRIDIHATLTKVIETE